MDRRRRSAADEGTFRQRPVVRLNYSAALRLADKLIERDSSAQIDVPAASIRPAVESSAGHHRRCGHLGPCGPKVASSGLKTQRRGGLALASAGQLGVRKPMDRLRPFTSKWLI